jgi:hypothetical protein
MKTCWSKGADASLCKNSVRRLRRNKTLGKVPFEGQELLYEVMGNLHNSGVAVIVVVIVAGIMVVGL